MAGAELRTKFFHMVSGLGLPFSYEQVLFENHIFYVVLKPCFFIRFLSLFGFIWPSRPCFKWLGHLGLIRAL